MPRSAPKKSPCLNGNLFHVEHDTPEPAPAGRDEYTDEFLAFWKLYPRREHKYSAWRAWKKHRPSLEKVRAALAWQVHQPAWTKDGGQFVPHPATWINAHGWDDEPFHIATQSVASTRLRARLDAILSDE